MRRYALDSSFIINFLEGDERAGEYYFSIKGGKLCIPAPVKLEVLRGVGNMGVLERIEKKEFSEKEVQVALDILDHLEQKNQMIGILDIMIASITTANSLQLVTFDRDFEQLKDYGGFKYKIVNDNE
ncbi:MAG: type II toxin-antitoxin system VapC family toxin [Candidatus Paceibacteria bacterium]